MGVLGKALERRWQRTRVTLEFSFSVPKARAAHHLAVFSLTVPLLPDLVVHTIVMAPFCGVGEIEGRQSVGVLTPETGDAQGRVPHGTLKARYLEGMVRKVNGHHPK